MMIQAGHSDKTYDKAKSEIARYEKHNEVDPSKPVWIPSVRTSSGCRFGYWRKVENTDEQ